MWSRRSIAACWSIRFFRLTLQDQSLIVFLKDNVQLFTNHGLSLTEIEVMTPFERTAYIQLIIAEMKKKADQNK